MVEAEAAPLREIHHVQRDDRRDAVGQQLTGQHQVARQIAGVDDDEHAVGPADDAIPAAEHVAHDSGLG